MCDYSLELYRAVPAVAGEQYTLARFASGSMGFTSGKTLRHRRLRAGRRPSAS